MDLLVGNRVRRIGKAPVPYRKTVPPFGKIILPSDGKTFSVGETSGPV